MLEHVLNELMGDSVVAGSTISIKNTISISCNSCFNSLQTEDICFVLQLTVCSDIQTSLNSIFISECLQGENAPFCHLCASKQDAESQFSICEVGVLFDEKMQWKYQIKNITQKASLKLGKIKAIASFLTPHTKKLLVNALVMPYFHYCSPAWSNAAPFRLSKINKKVVDASVFLDREDNYSIYNMLDKDISLLTFKALNNIAPNYLCSKIQMAKNCHSHNTRRAAKNHLQIPSSNTKFGMRTFAYRASKLWNDLPNELLDIKSLLKFKTSVKDFFN